MDGHVINKSDGADKYTLNNVIHPFLRNVIPIHGILYA